MADHFADRLTKAIMEKRAPACVGLDPLVERFPLALVEKYELETGADPNGQPGKCCGDDRNCASAVYEFSSEVIRAVAAHVPVVKLNVAFFERYHSDGLRTYFDLIRLALDEGLLVIGDVKRADIGHSATQYALAHLGPGAPCGQGGVVAADAVTVNPYFGFDGIRPFLEQAGDGGQGLFVLVQTSNESALQVQGCTLADGTSLCEHVARMVQGWASREGVIGDCGYSNVGAVVSPRDPSLTVRIRESMPNCCFLVPGFGAQGRTAQEVGGCFKSDGTGAVVTASRSVIYAYEDARYSGMFGDDWQGCIRQACRDFVADIRSTLGDPA